ncbi:RNA polymerase sigma-70 factor (sigma-E family) [Kitasatospora gansuensis]|uniref:RNA polymerase sigma-70 factor (Sigma-E family) n=1 Tax=Kitasatospora gansuensis TaxID=258050 RepID=A0A7W7WKM4_9ACTN|nr:SigE family RNA polymerase sigma factor [Kitasatospora gansuensis]MBB4949874.1 RNA polymerase sigma-70 factor (sigma-E family) [Kitasatospora gansuensis]
MGSYDDEAEFSSFVQGRWNGLVRTAYLLTGNRHDAEDLAQTTLTKVYASWRRVRSSNSPDAYVRRILVTSNIDRFRKRRLAEYPTDELPEPGGPHAPDANAQTDQRQVLFAALATLPARQRAVVVLRYWEDLSEAQVAAALDCSTGTVKSQAAKGLAKLRTHLGPTGLSTPATTDFRPEVLA